VLQANPNTIRSYRCDRCGRTLTVTVINPRQGDDLCECGGRYCVCIWEMKR